MQYETYKLGKMKKNPIRRYYTREELEYLDLPQLREICSVENIKPPTVETLYHKEEMVELLYRYLGAAKKAGIACYTEEGSRRLEEALEKDGLEQQGGIEVPARLELYKGFTSFDEKGNRYVASSRLTELGDYAFLTDGEGHIQAVVSLQPSNKKKYIMTLEKERMSPEIPTGRFRDMSLLFFEPSALEEAIRRYLGRERKKGAISYFRIRLPEVWIQEAPEAEEPLVIDYGTSYTTAGTFFNIGGAGGRIGFDPAPDCEWDKQEGCTFCGLCPSVIAIKDCSDAENMTFLFGKEAVQEEKNRGFLARNSIFYDTKRWVSRYRERILVTDLEGNSCEVERLFLIRQFLLYVIEMAQQQNKVHYKNICFTCPVKQKALSLRMYQEALPEYHVLTKDVTDEAVAVVYHSLEQRIKNLDYEDGRERRVLILDCGGGTSDMVSCDYRITNEAITSRLEMRVTYAHGDTNFGGNNLTYRVMQFLKIRLAEHYTHAAAARMDELFPGILSDIYEKIDTEGTERAYEHFSRIYAEAEAVVPTCFAAYQNKPESTYLKVKGNYYFLWNLAEAVKKKLYNRPGIFRAPLRSFFADSGKPGACFEDFHLFVKKERGHLETHTLCPDLILGKEEVNLLLKPDIYGFLKNFIEPWYESGRLSGIDRILLSGQSSKIDLFREVLKEYVAGRKAKAGGETGCARKFMCIDGAAAYQQARRTGRIRAALSYEPARVPYSLTAEDYEAGGLEKTLLEKGTPMGEVYGYLSRPVETEEILFHLKDGTGKEISCIPFAIHGEKYQETGYGEILSEYSFLMQEDLDSMQNGELRVFIYADHENWGFSILETAREGDRLYSRTPGFVPFEAGAWETDFFDGRH